MTHDVIDYRTHNSKALDALPRTADGYVIYPGMPIWMIGKYSSHLGLQQRTVQKVGKALYPPGGDDSEQAYVHGEAVDLSTVWFAEINGRQYVADEKQRIADEAKEQVRLSSENES